MKKYKVSIKEHETGAVRLQIIVSNDIKKRISDYNWEHDYNTMILIGEVN